jgi:hypothetical protein
MDNSLRKENSPFTTFEKTDGSLLELYFEDKLEGSSAFVWGARAGLTCFGAFLMDVIPNHDRRDKVIQLAKGLEESEEGAFVALVPPSFANGHPLVLIQDSRGPFYQRAHNPPTHVAAVWKDFSYRTLFVGLQQVSRYWSPKVAYVGPAPSSGWAARQAEVTVEVLHHLAAETQTKLERIFLHRCGTTLTEEELREALEKLAAEQKPPDAPAHRPIDWHWLETDSVVPHKDVPPGTRILQIPLESHLDGTGSRQA